MSKIVDGAIAAENICLCTHALGIGSVWLGTWPQMDRVQRQRELFDLPDTVIPHSVIALGYPAEGITTPRKSRYEENRVRMVIIGTGAIKYESAGRKQNGRNADQEPAA